MEESERKCSECKLMPRQHRGVVERIENPNGTAFNILCFPEKAFEATRKYWEKMFEDKRKEEEKEYKK